jgi:uncharacterized protein (TIGR02145 family)
MLFNLFVYVATSAQVIVTLQSKYFESIINLDSILVDNLTQRCRLQLLAPSEINVYEIDLMQGKIINGIPETNIPHATLQETINNPGHLQVNVSLSKPESIAITLFTLYGRETKHWNVACGSGSNLIDLHIGSDQLFICAIRSKEIFGYLKVLGKETILTTLVLSGAKEMNQPQREYPSATAFSFTPGDTVRFTAIKNGMHRNSFTSIPENSDSIIIFLSKPCPGIPTVADYEGNIYSTVLILDKCWMRENLKTRHYSDGSMLVDGTGAGDITNNFTTKYWFDYNDDPANADLLGRYYTGAAVVNSTDFSIERIQGVCPTGWHVSTVAEWCEMEQFFDSSITNCTSNQVGFFGNSIGYQLQDIDTVPYLIITPNNKGGFKGLLGGLRSFESFAGLYLTGNWWAYDKVYGSTMTMPLRALMYGSGTIYRRIGPTDVGQSVRCVKDY